MITEDYVSFETAKLLHSCGFWSDECVALYDCGNNNEFVRDDAIFQNGAEDYLEYENGEEWRRFGYYLAPTLQMAMKWLREVHNLFIFPFPQRNTNKFWTEIFQLSDNQEWENLYCESIDLQDYQTCEEACEAAIKYCLENLV